MAISEILSGDRLSIVIGLAATFIAVILPLLLNEHWKRKASLMEKLWDTKYGGLTSLLKVLWDFGDLMAAAIQFGSEINRRYEGTEKKLVATVFFWGEVNAKFLGDKVRIQALESIRHTEDLSNAQIRSAQKEALQVVGHLINRTGPSTEKPMLQLKLIVMDESILKTANKIVEFVADVYKRAESAEEIDFEKTLDRFQLMMREYGDKSRTELENTRTWKHSMRRRRGSKPVLKNP